MTATPKLNLLEIRERLARLPDAMRKSKRWLVHSPNKQPYYSDGTPRRGKLDSKEDVARLSTVEAALVALERDAGCRFAGLGFALGFDDQSLQYWQGLDLDHAIDADGNYSERAQEILDASNSYAERSPSGTGLHIIGRGPSFGPIRYQQDGEQPVEAYCEGRYFTVTGDSLGGSELENLCPLVETIRSTLAIALDKVRPPRTEFDQLVAESTVPPALRQWLAKHPIEAALAKHGFEESSPGRWLSPRSQSGGPGVQVNDRRRAVSFHARDAGLGTSIGGGGTIFNAFDLDVEFAYGGDRNRAWRELIAPEAALLAASSRADPRQYVLRSLSELEDMPPPRWLIDGLLPERGIATVYGAPGTGKSFLLLDLVMAIAAGRPWFGRMAACKPAVYLLLEGRYGVSPRVRAALSRHGEPQESVYVIFEEFSLNSPADVVALAEAIRSVGPIGLLVVDTLNRAAGGSDENDSRDMGRLIDGLQSLERELECLVVVVHHSGKTEGRGPRGHSSLLAAVDVAIEVTRDPGGTRRWKCAKNKDGPEGGDHAFDLESVEIESGPGSDQVESAVVVEMPGAPLHRKRPKGANQRAVLDALEQRLKPMTGETVDTPATIGASTALQIAQQALTSKVPIPRRRERAKGAIDALIRGGHLRGEDDAIRLP